MISEVAVVKSDEAGAAGEDSYIDPGTGFSQPQLSFSSAAGGVTALGVDIVLDGRNVSVC